MKKLLIILFVIASVPLFASDSISNTIVEKFKSDFPHAKNVKWYFNAGASEVYYEEAGVTCHMWYNEDGKVVKTRRYYSEKDLAPYLKAKIAQRYPNKTIFGVTESSTPEGVDYLITLEDSKNWLQVTCDGTGELSVMKKMKKSA